MQAYYYDANALIDWSWALLPGTDKREAEIGGTLLRLIHDSSNINGASELSIVEFVNRLCIFERNSELPQCDEEWVDNCYDQVIGWIGDQHLKIVEPPPKLLEKTMSYIRFVTREKGRNLRSWDAAHLIIATNWSRDLGSVVNLATSDGDFAGILNAFPEFANHVQVYDLKTDSIIS